MELALNRPRAAAVREALGRHGLPVLVPAHFDAEGFATVRRFMLRGEVDPDSARRATRLIGGFPATRYALAPMLDSAFQLAKRFSAGDAFYVVLAREAKAPLLTCDGRLARGAEGLIETLLVAE